MYNTNCKKLSTDWRDTSIIHLQQSRLEDLWKKAEDILNTKNFILPAAGNTSARQVASASNYNSSLATPPHFVFTKKTSAGVQVHCDCHVYKSLPNVCQHSLAAAEDMQVLNEYLKWVTKTTKGAGLNVSNLISKEVPKSAGKKTSTSRRKGAPKGVKKPILVEKNGIGNTDSTSKTTNTFDHFESVESSSSNQTPSYPSPMFPTMFNSPQFSFGIQSFSSPYTDCYMYNQSPFFFIFI